MKTFQKGILVLLAIFSIASLVTSCSKEDEVDKNSGTNSKVSNYLKSFYSKDFVLGRSIDAKIVKNAPTLSATAKSEEVDDVVITEVLVGDDNRARGYVVTTKETNTFIYFVDVDRIDYKLTSADIELNDVEVMKDINQLDKYIESNEFDLIRMTQEYINEQNNNPENKHPFWGWAYEEGPCGAAGEGLAYVYHNHYIAGIRNHHDQQFFIDDNTRPLIEPCGFRD